jgi:hypothetical protein
MGCSAVGKMVKIVTEYRGRVFNMFAPYSGGPRLKSWPEDQIS